MSEKGVILEALYLVHLSLHRKKHADDATLAGHRRATGRIKDKIIDPPCRQMRLKAASR